MAGVELATVSEPPARQPRIWGRRHAGVDPRRSQSCTLRLNHVTGHDRGLQLTHPGLAPSDELTTGAPNG